MSLLFPDLILCAFSQFPYLSFIWRLIKKFEEKKRGVHVFFIDSEKGYDTMPRLWGKEATKGYCDAIQYKMTIWNGILVSIDIRVVK